MSAVLKPQPNQFNRWVTFRLADEIYGINVMQVQEVLRLSEVAPVPGAPAAVLGIINLRGHVVTVIDARLLFSLPLAEHSDQTRIMIVECNRNIVGLLVDAVCDILSTADHVLQKTPDLAGDQMQGFVKGLIALEGRMISLIDLALVLDTHQAEAA